MLRTLGKRKSEHWCLCGNTAMHIMLCVFLCVMLRALCVCVHRLAPPLMRIDLFMRVS